MEATVLSKRRKRRRNRNPNIANSSLSPTVTEMQQSPETLTPQSRHAPPLPTLPFELVAEILCRLPVKLLVQLRCLCYVNWLTYDGPGSQREIVSLDLEDESYYEIFPPDLETDLWTLGEAWDRLCIFASNEMFMDVWIMKEYGNKESWTKLCKVPYLEDQSRRLRAFYKAFYLSADGQVVLDAFVPLKLAVYDSKTDALKIREIQNRNGWKDPKVYIESLISPCS